MTSKKQALDAAARLHMADCEGPAGKELLIAAGGGYGDAKRKQLVNDIRTLVDAILEPPSSPFGDSAA